jgi:3-hydroxy-3-methylglutaryl CoA synthase
LMSGFEMKKAKHGALVNIRNVKRWIVNGDWKGSWAIAIKGQKL